MNIRGFWKQRFAQWLARRIPPSGRVTLDQRSIFIVPSKAGYGFLMVAFLIFLVAINYQNSLAYMVCFFMVALFLVAMLHTWRNLAGLTVINRGAQPVFCGEQAVFKVLVLSSEGRNQHSIKLGWPGNQSVIVDPERESSEADVCFLSTARGWLKPGRLKLSTEYPLGLFYAWSWVDLKQSVMVYPVPDKEFSVLPSNAAMGEGKDLALGKGCEDFTGLREATVTDSMAHISWKAFSRTGELLTKQFMDYLDSRCWLDFNAVPGRDVEEKLSRLCNLVLLCRDRQLVFGLQLPGQDLQPDKGNAHLQKCLEALAVFDQ